MEVEVVCNIAESDIMPARRPSVRQMSAGEIGADNWSAARRRQGHHLQVKCLRRPTTSGRKCARARSSGGEQNLGRSCDTRALASWTASSCIKMAGCWSHSKRNDLLQTVGRFFQCRIGRQPRRRQEPLVAKCQPERALVELEIIPTDLIAFVWRCSRLGRRGASLRASLSMGRPLVANKNTPHAKAQLATLVLEMSAEIGLLQTNGDVCVCVRFIKPVGPIRACDGVSMGAPVAGCRPWALRRRQYCWLR